MVSVSVEVDDHSAQVALNHTSNAVTSTSLAEFLRTDAVDWLQARAQNRFSAEGDDASGFWKPLKWPTENFREAMGVERAHPINKRTGKLEDFVTSSRGMVAPRGQGAALMWPGPAGDPILEGKLQTAQKGKRKPNTVARPVVAANQIDVYGLQSAMAAWIEERTGAVFG